MITPSLHTIEGKRILCTADVRGKKVIDEEEERDDDDAVVK